MRATAWSPTMQAVQAAFNHAHAYGRAVVELGGQTLDVHVARTPEQWARGMVGHDEVERLLFVMPPGSRSPFHMRNMTRDLAIGFFDEAGRRVDVGFLAAGHGYKQPRRPYRYALEVAVSNISGVRALLGGTRLAVVPP